MSLQLYPIQSIQITFRALPANLSDVERQRLAALTAMSYVGALGRVIAFLSTARLQDLPAEELHAELEHGLQALGELQASLAELSYVELTETIQ